MEPTTRHPSPLDDLDLRDPAFDDRWAALEAWLHDRFGQDVGIDGLLFLIGLQAQSRGFEPDLSKEEKQNLIMEGSYCALASLGFYEQVGMEPDGAWIWERLHPLPTLAVDDQERLLCLGILKYFEPFM